MKKLRPFFTKISILIYLVKLYYNNQNIMNKEIKNVLYTTITRTSRGGYELIGFLVSYLNSVVTKNSTKDEDKAPTSYLNSVALLNSMYYI
jgi:hypothetical protein